MHRFGRRIKRKFRVLKYIHTPADLILFVRVLLFGALVPIFMRQPLPRAAEWLVSTTSPTGIDPTTVQKLICYTDGALHMGRPLTQVRCLTRGVTLYYFLSRAGMDISLHFGAGKVDGEFAAHCWLESEGVPFAEDIDPYSRYKTTYIIPSGHVALKPDATGSNA